MIELLPMLGLLIGYVSTLLQLRRAWRREKRLIAQVKLSQSQVEDLLGTCTTQQATINRLFDIIHDLQDARADSADTPAQTEPPP